MDSKGNIRELKIGEEPQADEVELSGAEVAVLEKVPKTGRIGYYKAKRLKKKFSDAALKIIPKSKRRKRPKSVFPKSLRRKHR